MRPAGRGHSSARRARARRLAGAGTSPAREPERVHLLAEGIGAAVSLGASTAAPARAVFLFQETEVAALFAYRIVDEWGEGGEERFVRQEGAGVPRPGAPLRVTDAGLPPLDAETRELDKRRLVEVDIGPAGQPRLRRMMAESRGVPMRNWAIVAGAYPRHDEIPRESPRLLPSEDPFEVVMVNGPVSIVRVARRLREPSIEALDHGARSQLLGRPVLFAWLAPTPRDQASGALGVEGVAEAVLSIGPKSEYSSRTNSTARRCSSSES